MSPGTIISIGLTIIGCILAIFFYMNDSLDKRIETAVKHPDFIKKVAEASRLPFLVFDENGTFQAVSEGATEIIEKIEPYNEKDKFRGFIVYPKYFLKDAPILQSINNNTPFVKPKRINTIDWQFRIPEWDGSSWGGTYDEPPAKTFKLEIIK